jgi:thiol-disulfide isomerase/thioredoxin
MKLFCLGAVALLCSFVCVAQEPSYKTDPSYQKEMAKALDAEHRHRYDEELEWLKSACKKAHDASTDCLNKLMKVQSQMGDYKAAAESAAKLEVIVQNPKDKATASLWRGSALMRLNRDKRKQEGLAEADKELKNALSLDPDLNFARFIDGQVLALMNQDDAAKAEFASYVEHAKGSDTFRERCIRFAANPALAREKMAPPFSIVTSDGTPLSLDSLNGRVVLLDFWATWCGPCKLELPHVRKLAQKYAGRPFVVLSVSIDRDESKWKDYITKNEMNWLQYNDAKGNIADLFGVHSIPHYFTIDTDGILRSEDVGDEANIDGRIKKLVGQAEASHAESTKQTGSATGTLKEDLQTALANLADRR